MTNIEKLLKLSVAGSWIVFVAVVVFLPAAWSSPLEILRSVIGIAGAIIAIWFVYSTARSAAKISFMFSVSFLVLALAELAFRGQAYLAVDPEYGLLKTTWLKVSTLVLGPLKLFERGAPLPAAGELYWMVAMPLLQLLIICLFLRYWTKGTSSSPLRA